MNAHDLFLARKAEIDGILASIAARSTDNFGVSLDHVHWGDAASMGHVVSRLRELAEFLGLPLGEVHL